MTRTQSGDGSQRQRCGDSRKCFQIPESQVVTIQKHGGEPVEIELGDLLKRIERKQQQQPKP